jgi:exonuclease SbcC
LLQKESEASSKKERYSLILKLENDFKEKEKSIRKASNELSIYQELSLIFGKKGIQKMVIESAVPQIEELANELLSKMTEGEMRISLVTEREKKSDKDSIIETLDIKITDNAGKRDYELFSGGEAFRINFSIRVALSKLLARKSGASLKFLVIDEGFGTQDAEGRAHLVDAINSIKDEFEKILVITHIQELKDLFDQRIDVTKDSEGSHISVIS